MQCVSKLHKVSFSSIFEKKKLGAIGIRPLFRILYQISEQQTLVEHLHINTLGGNLGNVFFAF